MKREEKAVMTFKSTHYAIEAEGVFKENGLSFKTIPTPREITYSCGLAILFSLEDVPRIRALVEEDVFSIDGLYKYARGTSNPVEKII